MTGPMGMDMGNMLFWGFASTVVLTTLLTATRSLGYTRMDIPLMLGTLVTPNRNRARWIGMVFHFTFGWAFSFLYIMAFLSAGMKSVWFGMMVGLVHAMFLLIVGMTILPTFHPRMATENYGPDPTRQLEPPGFMALNYGRGTPISTVISHILYGAILAYFYH